MPKFGDVEAAVVDILGDSAAVSAYGSVGIATDLIGYSPGDKWLRVVRIGGTPTVWMRFDNPLVEIAAYGPDKATALDLAAAARDAVYAARGNFVGRGLSLFDVGDEDGLAWKPDERNPTTPRYLFTLSLVTRPA